MRAVLMLALGGAAALALASCASRPPDGSIAVPGRSASAAPVMGST